MTFVPLSALVNLAGTVEHTTAFVQPERSHDCLVARSQRLIRQPFDESTASLPNSNSCTWAPWNRTVPR